MRHIPLLAGLFAAVPALAHETGPISHNHPHGIETLVALLALALLVFVVWKARQ